MAKVLHYKTVYRGPGDLKIRLLQRFGVLKGQRLPQNRYIIKHGDNIFLGIKAIKAI